jgi:hypothetical protein
MRLAPGFTCFRGIVMNQLEADGFRSMVRQLRRHVDARRPVEAQQFLGEIKAFAGDNESYREVFETIRREQDDRWRQRFGTSWKSEL